MRYWRLKFFLSNFIACSSLYALAGSQPSHFPVTFVDIAAQAGLTRPVIYGGVETKKYIIETNGSGRDL